MRDLCGSGSWAGFLGHCQNAGFLLLGLLGVSPSPSRSALEGIGFEIVEERHPSFLLDGSVLITGEVDRTTEFEIGFPGHEAHRDSAWQADPLIPTTKHSS